MLDVECDKETYDYQYIVNWQTAYKTQYTPRILMQHIGTNLFRDQLLNNIWVNALFANYKSECTPKDAFNKDLPNWIITDVRFPNEVEAIKKRRGIVIRVNRPNINKLIDSGIDVSKLNQHESETALDNYTDWDYIIDNNGSIEDLIEKVKQMLIHFKIL